MNIKTYFEEKLRKKKNNLMSVTRRILESNNSKEETSLGVVVDYKLFEEMNDIQYSIDCLIKEAIEYLSVEEFVSLSKKRVCSDSSTSLIDGSKDCAFVLNCFNSIKNKTLAQEEIIQDKFVHNLF